MAQSLPLLGDRENSLATTTIKNTLLLLLLSSCVSACCYCTLSRMSCRIFSRSSSILRCFSFRRSSASLMASRRSRSASSSLSLVSPSSLSPPPNPASPCVKRKKKIEINLFANLSRGFPFISLLLSDILAINSQVASIPLDFLGIGSSLHWTRRVEGSEKGIRRTS